LSKKKKRIIWKVTTKKKEKNENENKRMEDGNKGEKCPSKRTSRPIR
jgi:hypothetical protein